MAYLEQTQSRNPAERIKTGLIPTGEASKESSRFAATEQWLPTLILLLLLIGWEISVDLGWISALFFPAPTTIGHTFVEQLASGQLLGALAATGRRLSYGLLLGGGLGLLGGLLMGWSSQLRQLLNPTVAALHAIPKIPLLPLVMIIFGIGEVSKIILIAVSVFFPMVINTMAGVQQIAPIHFEVAQNYGARPFKLFTRVILPGALPLILAGIRLATNTALVITIALELLSARKGLGAIIWLAWETMRIEELYVALTVTALLGIGFSMFIDTMTRKFLPWQGG